MTPLFAVRDYLKRAQVASTSQIARELSISPDLVEELLGHWQRRGFVQVVDSPTQSSGCAMGSCKTCPVNHSHNDVCYSWEDQTPH